MFRRARNGTGLKWAFALAALCIAAVNGAENDPARWEKDIQVFERWDREKAPPKNAVLFAGSSSIRLWPDLAGHFPELTVIQRGFGGSQMEDLNYYADRIVLPYRPSKIVVYEGDNDIAAGKAPARVVNDFQKFVKKVHAELPKTEIYFIAIKPSPSRWHLADPSREANRLVAEFAEEKPRVTYVDIWTPMLNEEGKPRRELFTPDNLHMNEKGYELWTDVLKKAMGQTPGE